MKRNYWTPTGRRAAQAIADRVGGTVEAHQTTGLARSNGTPKLAVAALPIVPRG